MPAENLPRRRESYLMPVTGNTRASLRDPRLKGTGIIPTLVGRSILDAMMITFVTTVLGSAAFGLADMMNNGIYNIIGIGGAFLGVYATSLAALTLTRVKGALRSHDDKVLASARGRVLQLINDGYGFTGDKNEGHFARTVVCNPDQWPGARNLLMRLDAIAVQHGETAKRIEHDTGKTHAARGIARNASYSLIRAYREETDADAADLEIEDMSRAIRAIVDGRTLDATPKTFAPTARIARIISTAERALSSNPDLVDSTGARVDALIRVHVPRLLERHRAAAETACAKDMESVDAQLDTAVEDVRASVEEALSSAHDEAMDALAAELGFLSLRRGTTSLLSAVA